MNIKTLVFNTFALAALFSFPSLTHASITPSLSPSRTTGVAPLSVFFDASGTTASSTTLPFHELDYSWNFGDDDSATWAYGSNPGINKKNRAFGPVASHVFETPGTYTVTLSVYDGTDTSTTTQVITVTDPDTVFSGANTICFSTAGTFTSCPSGATQVTTSDFDTAINTYMGTGKRLLFRKGEVFAADANGDIDVDGPGLVGAFGTGARPIIQLGASVATFRLSSATTPNIDDWRIMDMDIDGQSYSDSCGVFGHGNIDQVTVVRVSMHHVHNGFSFSPTYIDYYNNNGNPGHDMYDQLTVYDSSISTIIGGSGGNGFFVAATRMAVMGTRVYDTTGGEHVFRSMYFDKLVLANNSFEKPAPTKAVLTLRAQDWDCTTCVALPPHTYSQYALISDNEFIAGPGVNAPVNTSIDSSYDARTRHIIFERNWWHGFIAGGTALSLNSSYSTIRNNVIDITTGSDLGARCMNVANNGGSSPNPTDNQIYNNVCFNNDTALGYTATIRNIHLFATAINTIVKNNLHYTPNAAIATTNTISVDDSGVGTIGASGTFGNSSDVQAKIDPLFTNGTGTFSAMSDFKFLTASYAKDAGTAVPVYRDFLGTLRPQNAPLYDMGAFEFESADVTPPTLTESLAIATGTDTTPDYTFSTTEAGTIAYGGDCTSATTNAILGSNTITFATLSIATHSNCTITVTDSSTNASTPLSVTAFTIDVPSDTTPPTLTESSPIGSTSDTTPSYTFSTTEAGSLTYGGDCTSSTTTATSGSNTITFATLSVGTHTNCTIQVTDASSNASTPLAITSFTITEESIATPEVAGTSSSSSNNSKPKKKKISGNITYQKGERIAPWITLLTPTSNTPTNKKFTIKATSKDKSGIQAMFITVNGIKKKRMNTGSILYTAKKKKNASITISAYDTLGNVKVAQITITNGAVTGVRYY